LKKRFTDCDKWRDPWFRKLSPSAKLMWQWLLDQCDGAGVIEPDWELAEFQIGTAISTEVIAELEERVEKLEQGKLWITKFIDFQYGTLSPSCKAHKPVYISLDKYGLSERVSDTLSEGYVKGPRKRKRKGQEIPYPSDPVATGFAPTVEQVIAYASTIPCSKDCAEAYHADRAALNWTKVKGGLQVDIEDWRNDLRRFAGHWRANEAERQARMGTNKKPVTREVDTRPEKRMKL